MKNKPVTHSISSRLLPWPLNLSECLGLVLGAAVGTTTLPALAGLPDVTSDYTIEVLQPPPGAVLTGIFWVEINASGMVAMQYNAYIGGGTINEGQTAIREKGVWTVINVPGSEWTGCSNPNASGQVGVVYATADGNWHNAIYDHGEYTDLPDYKAAPGQPPYQYGTQTINDRWIMTGVAFDPTGMCFDPINGFYCLHGLVLNASLSLFRVFDYPGAASTYPMGINNSGLMVGGYTDWDSTGHAFFGDKGGNLVNIDPPDSSSCVLGGEVFGSEGIMINNQGEICGFYVDASTGVLQGFLLRQGSYSAFNIPGSTATQLNCITENGTLAGFYIDSSSAPHPFIAVPKPGLK
jgi:hypothetical protein